MHLVVVESPAKCKKIGSYLGSDFKVIATMGHIRALEEDLDAVGLERDFEPRFTFMKEKTKALANLKDAAKGVDTVYLAADDDREGEAIAYSVAVFLRRDPLTLPRIVFHEITEKAIKAAVANPRSIDMNKVYAQQTRAMLDMMVGFTISPVLWKYVAPKLSAGRCQTPALRLVCDREAIIQNHTSKSSWGLRATFKEGFEAAMMDELEDEDSVMNYMENVHSSSVATILSNRVAPWSLNPPRPLITSSLQQEASALYHCNPKQTMRIAQELYEAGHITYMRTDSTAMSEEAVSEGRKWVEANHGSDYLGPVAVAVVGGEDGQKKSPAAGKAAKKKVTAGDGEAQLPEAQEAHECIRPTHMDLVELPQQGHDWSSQHKSIYKLIWRRAMQSLMSAMRGEKRTVQLNLNEDADRFVWAAVWSRTLFQGWKVLGATANLDAESEEGEGTSAESAWKIGQALKEGTACNWTTLSATPKHTKPQPRFTEATLIRELEAKGIGRPSTFASLVETLLEKGYVEKKDVQGQVVQIPTLTLKPTIWPPETTKKQQKQGAEKGKLLPTSLGTQALQFCVKEFPQLFAYTFTAEMEGNLDKVAKGELPWKQVCRDTWGSYKDHYLQLKQASLRGGDGCLSSAKHRDFGDGLKAVLSKKGPLLLKEGDITSFYSWPANLPFEDMTAEKARAIVKEQEGEKAVFGDYNGKPIVKKKGPFGEYVECGGLRCPCVAEDTRESILAKLKVREEAAKTAKSGEHVVGGFTFKKGQYGPYMFKNSLKKKIFVSVPESISVQKLTATEADALYKAGLEKLEARKKKK